MNFTSQGVESLTLAKSGGKGKHRTQVITFEIAVVAQDFLKCHSGTQEFQQYFDWIA